MPDGLIVYVAGVAALAGLVQGIAGFAYALVATSLLAWVLAPGAVVPLVVAGSIVAQLGSLVTVRTRLDWRRVAPFVIGGLAGVPIGTQLLVYVDVEMFQLGVGIALTVYSGIMLAQGNFPVVRLGGRGADALVGLVAGTMGGVCALSGPPLTLWCALRAWSKDTQRGVFQAFFLSTQTMTLATMLHQGLLTREIWTMIAFMVPAAVLGSMLGGRLFRRFSDLAFRQVIFVLLLVSGIALMLPAARTLL